MYIYIYCYIIILYVDNEILESEMKFLSVVYTHFDNLIATTKYNKILGIIFLL